MYAYIYVFIQGDNNLLYKSLQKASSLENNANEENVLFIYWGKLF